MQSVETCDAKTHGSKLLERVCQGERFTITECGVPVAQPPYCEKTTDVEPAIVNLRKLRPGHRPGRTTVREMIEAGRR